MSSFLGRFADEVRRVARVEAKRVSRPIEQYKILRLKPLKLECFRNDSILEEGDVDLAVGRGIRALMKKGDTAYVAVDREGDYVLVSVASPTEEDGDEEFPTFVGAEKAMTGPNLVIPVAFEDVPNCTFTLPSSGVYRIQAVCDILASGPGFVAIGKVLVDGVQLSGSVLYSAAGANDRGTVTQVWHEVKGQKGDVVKLQIGMTGSGAYTLGNGHTKLVIEKVGR